MSNHLSEARNATQRILGVDAARGLAVLGMIAAHTAVVPDLDWARPETWLGIVNHRSAVLFAVLAGVSLALMTGGSRRPHGAELVRARIRVLARAVAIILIGSLVVSLNTGLATILEVWGVVFLLALPLIGLGRRALLGVAVAIFVGAAFVVVVGSGRGVGGWLFDITVSGYYPAVVWIGFVTVGMVIGSQNLRSRAVQLRMIAAGLLMAVVGYTVEALLMSTGVPPLQVAGIDLSLAFHPSTPGSTVGMIGATGVALTVIGVFLLLPAAAQTVLYPIRAVGSMPLTAYVGHAVAYLVLFLMTAATREDPTWRFLEPNDGVSLGFVITTLLVCSLWRVFVGQGPLERGVARFVAAFHVPQEPHRRDLSMAASRGSSLRSRGRGKPAAAAVLGSDQ